MEKINVKIDRYRHEIKYLCNKNTACYLSNALAAVMKKDSNAGATGSYMIESLYFDDYVRTCARENIDGTDPRSKWRIRVYNNNMDMIRLECKQKYNGMGKKRSCIINKEELDALMAGDSILTEYIGREELLDEFISKIIGWGYRPSIIVSYEREPYISLLGNTRITLDRKIVSSDEFSCFGKRKTYGRSVLSEDMLVLEVKYDEFLPDAYRQIISSALLERTAFSKYYLCYEIGKNRFLHSEF